MIRAHHQAMGMPLAAMPLLRMQPQTTTLDSLNWISRPPSCEIAEVAVEDRRAISSALDVVQQIASQSASSYSSLVSWTVQQPSCAIVEVTGSGNESETRATQKSRLRQLIERIGALVAFIPPIIFVMYLYREERRKVKELQDQCIAIEQRAIVRAAWSEVWEICQRAARFIYYDQLYNDPSINIQQKCARKLWQHWQSCQGVLEGAKERCEIIERIHRREHFRLDLIHRLKFLKEHYPDT